MKLTFFLFLENVWQKHFLRCKPIFFLVEWAKIYTIEEGVWNILNIFRFLFLSNFTDKLYVTFEKKGGGTAFQNLFFGINMRIESTYEYGGTSPPPTPALLRPVFQNEQGKIYTMYVKIFTRWCFHSQKCVSDLQKTWQEICYLSATALGEWHRYLYVDNSPVNLSIMYLGNCITVYLCTCVPVYI